MVQYIQTSKAPAAIGPYNQAVLVNNTLYISGQIALHPETGKLVGNNVTEQTDQVFKNIQAILESANCHLTNAVKVVCYLVDIQSFQEMNLVYDKYFTSNYPARTTVAVKELPRNALVEIEVTAVLV